MFLCAPISKGRRPFLTLQGASLGQVKLNCSYHHFIGMLAIAQRHHRGLRVWAGGEPRAGRLWLDTCPGLARPGANLGDLVESLLLLGPVESVPGLIYFHASGLVGLCSCCD